MNDTQKVAAMWEFRETCDKDFSRGVMTDWNAIKARLALTPTAPGGEA